MNLLSPDCLAFCLYLGSRQKYISTFLSFPLCGEPAIFVLSPLLMFH